MATIHFILQGKGGVGKSIVASFFCQALLDANIPFFAYDTDPVNATLAGYKSLNVERVEVMKNGVIDPEKFDALIEEIMKLPDDSHAVVDNGASSFIALGSYIQENNLFSLLTDEGHTIFLHTVVTAGQAMMDTLSGLDRLFQNFPETQKVIWLNPFFGNIVLNGKNFSEFALYTNNANQVKAIIELPNIYEYQVTGRDVEKVISRRQNFKDVITSPDSFRATRSRLKRFWDNLRQIISAAGLY